MDIHHLHLALNHIPVLGLLFGLAILAYATLRRQDSVIRVAFGLFGASGVGAVVAYLTGEGAEEVVENIATIPHAVIESHEEMGLIALISATVVGGLALIALVVWRTVDIPRWVIVVAFVLAIGASGVVGYTANLGGQIRHPELRATSSVPGSGGAQAVRSTNDSHEDEDHNENDDHNQ